MSQFKDFPGWVGDETGNIAQLSWDWAWQKQAYSHIVQKVLKKLIKGFLFAFSFLTEGFFFYPKSFWFINTFLPKEFWTEDIF